MNISKPDIVRKMHEILPYEQREYQHVVTYEYIINAIYIVNQKVEQLKYKGCDK